MATCPRCGNQVTENAAFCSKCGQKLEAPVSPAQPGRTKAPEPRKERQGCGLSMAVVLTALVVALAIIAIGVGAVYMGLNDRNSADKEMAAEHYDKGVAYLEQGQLDLAVAEFDLAVQLDPDHDEAQDGLSEAQGRLQAQPTDTPVLSDATKDAYMRDITSAYEQQNWAQVIETADLLIALDPAHERARVDQMVVASFVAQGQAAAANGQIGDAMALYDRALVLDPANGEALREQELATLYASALASWNSDWPAVLESLDALYATAPTYLDAEDRLYDAYVALGESLAASEAWCDAAQAFSKAMDVRLSTQVVTRHQDATAKCQAASATPSGDDTQPADQATPGDEPAGPVGPSGTYVGRLVTKEHLGGTSIFLRGHVYNPAGQGVASARVQIQAWDWTAVAVTDADGQFSFDGLGNPVTYTLTLLDATSQPFDVGLEEGVMTWVAFQQVR